MTFIKLYLVASMVAAITSTSALAVPNSSTEALLDIASGTYAAFQHKDWKAMQSLTTDDFTLFGPGGSLTGQELAVQTEGCTLHSFNLSSPQLKNLTPTSVVLTYVAHQDESCDGKQMPAVLQNADIFVLRDGKWLLSTHMEAEGRDTTS